MLYLYKGITPNFTKTHYVFSDFNNYLTFLETYKIKEINNDKYTLNNLSIRIKLDASISELDYKNVTYIINTSDNVCYLVNNSKIQSGYIFFNVSVDNWGTYISKASFSDILVRRCNRKLSDNGVYDAIANTSSYDIELFENTTYNFENTKVVIIASVDLWGNMCFTCTPSTFRRMLQIDITTWGMLVSAISKCDRWWFSPTDSSSAGLEMKIQHAYIVPNDCVIGSSVSTDIHAIGISGTQSADLKVPVNVVYVNSTKQFTKDININKRHTIGGVNGNLHFLNLTSKKVTPLYYFSYSQDEVRIIITDGDAQQDITKSFEISLTSVERSVKASEDISNVLRYFLGVAQVGVGIARHSPLSITKGIGTLGNQLAQDVTPKQEEQKGVNIVASGSGITSYGSNITSLVSPFKCFSALSIYDEEKHARKLGANFNEYIDTITEIYNKELLGTGESTDDTYIQANMEVSNIPTDAINDITGRFNNGVNTQLL